MALLGSKKKSAVNLHISSTWAEGKKEDKECVEQSEQESWWTTKSREFDNKISIVYITFMTTATSSLFYPTCHSLHESMSTHGVCD